MAQTLHVVSASGGSREEREMKKLLAIALFAATTSLFGQVSFGIRIGAPPPPRVVRVRPHAPGPGYVWVDGYWYAKGNRYRWQNGYWARPPYVGAAWMAPRYEGGQFYQGYWRGNNDRDRFERGRDYDRRH